jgi:hypothetical protein
MAELDSERWELDKVVFTSVVVVRADVKCVVTDATAGPTARPWNPARFIREITIEDTGERGKRLSISGEFLYKLLYVLWGRPPSYDAFATADFEDTGTVYGHVEFPIPMYFLRGQPSEFGTLKTQGSAPVYVEVDTGDETDLAYGGTWAATVTADVSVHQITVAPRHFDKNGYGSWILNSQRDSNLVAGQNRFNLTPQKRHRLVAIDAFAGDSEEDLPSDAVLDHTTDAFVVRHGSVGYPIRATPDAVRDRLYTRHGLPQTPRDDAATPDWSGFYCYEFGIKDQSLDTMFSSLLNGKGINSLELLPEMVNPVPDYARVEVAELYLHGED